MKIGLLGAPLDTGNMGVSALAESSMKVILNRWPDAEIILMGSVSKPQKYHLHLMGKEICVSTLPIKLSKNVFLPYNIMWFVLHGLLVKLLPGSWLKDRFASLNPYFRIIYETDIVTDITGGDSFSDIYGMGRFFSMFLHKWLFIFLNKELILLPQTYGPFKRSITKILARYVMNHASVVYSRDMEGIEYTRKLINIHSENGKVKFAPDVAFVLDSREPGNIDTGSIETRRTKNSVVVGLNISGLLLNGGYTQENMFGLKTDYRELVYSVIDYLMSNKRVLVLLVPHVFSPHRIVEDDPNACREVYEQLSEKYPGRIFLARGRYDHNDIKYIIGLCNFFIGSRMHACIAALSQTIPAVGIAYSKKFQGVFESVGLGDCVADAFQCSKDEVLSTVTNAFENREQMRKHLNEIMPGVKANILNMFEARNTG